MIFTPGQPVIVLDTTHKPAGTGIVQVYYAETDRCQVLFQYPDKTQPESIPVPVYRLVAQAAAGAPHI
ncbi:MAG: hypothetical protein JST42_06925 [Bacteroidetes bacterium]|nr:hypothetical protein [Bacteroidota bacterium]